MTSETNAKSNEQSKTTIFAVRTTIGREKTVQELIFNRLRTINPVPDLKAILTSEHYRGYVFVEAILQHDVVHVTTGLPHVKGKVVGSIPFDSIEGIIKPERISKTLEEGDIVEVINGPLNGTRGEITKISHGDTKDEITVKLFNNSSMINSFKVASDSVKLIQKAEKAITEYVINEDKKMIEEQIGTTATKRMEASAASDNDGTLANYGLKSEEVSVPDAIEEELSFDDEFDDDEEFDAEVEEVAPAKSAEEVTEGEDEGEEEEDEDDWAKFMDY